MTAKRPRINSVNDPKRPAQLKRNPFMVQFIVKGKLAFDGIELIRIELLNKTLQKLHFTTVCKYSLSTDGGRNLAYRRNLKNKRLNPADI